MLSLGLHFKKADYDGEYSELELEFRGGISSKRDGNDGVDLALDFVVRDWRVIILKGKGEGPSYH